MFKRRPTTVIAPGTEESSPAPPSATAEPVGAVDAPSALRVLADHHVTSPPSPQNAIDLFQGSWSCGLPSVLRLQAGELPAFADDRIRRVLTHLDSIKSFKVLELGPLEGGHTYMIHEGGARVIAVESNALAFLKCLVVKEILNLNRAHFLLGDFAEYLRATTDRYDLVVASGVLYESNDPLGLLAAIARVTDRVAIWSHYWAAAALERSADQRKAFAAEPRREVWGGRGVTLHPRTRDAAAGDAGVWMERDDLMAVLAGVGLTRITVLDDEIDHVNGPAILLCAERE